MIDLAALSSDDKKIFTDYLENHFSEKILTPDEDISFLDFWESVVEDAGKSGTAETLNQRVVPARPVQFKDPENISIEIYKSTAGKIPVIKIKSTEDFENFIINLIHKGNRPENISATGASFVSGKTTRFIVLSNKPYSNVSAKTLGLDVEAWKEQSMTIRLEHECTHYYTKKFYGAAQNHLHDELMADFFGLYEAFGKYNAEYFEYFMGIKGTEGSRLKCYIPDCSEELFSVLKETGSVCARWLQKWSESEEFSKLSKEERINFLCHLELKDIVLK